MDAAEVAREVAGVAVADDPHDLGDGYERPFEQHAGTREADRSQISHRRDARLVAKQMRESRRRQRDLFGEGRDGQWLAETGVDVLDRPGNP